MLPPRAHLVARLNDLVAVLLCRTDHHSILRLLPHPVPINPDRDPTIYIYIYIILAAWLTLRYINRVNSNGRNIEPRDQTGPPISEIKCSTREMELSW